MNLLQAAAAVRTLSQDRDEVFAKTASANQVVNTSGLRPLGRAVLLKPYKVEKMSVGGIILPLSVQEKDQIAEQKAVVVEVGPGAWPGEAPWCAVGDHIVFTRWAGYQAVGVADGEIYRVVNDNDIFMQIVGKE